MNLTTHYLHSLNEEEDIDIPVLVDQIIADAVQADASDIHIESWESTVVVRLRLNGVLTELAHLPKDIHDRVAARIKVMASLVSYQTSLPQEGHAVAPPELGSVQLRISAFPTVRGEKIVIRLFNMANRSFDLNKLGFETDTLHYFVHLINRPSGLILLTGPTGSGKTTAIYSALSHIVQRSGPRLSISTVEDPVEFSLSMVAQTAINPVQGLTYPVAIRSLLRQDPQVIMIGEIRDPETASIAVQAGLTGHLVISTIHSGSTAGVFARLMNMDIEPFLLASSISGVLGIRLIRCNCPYCAQTYTPEPWLLKQLKPEMIENAKFLQGIGCTQCLQTGFLGRSALTELLVVKEAFQDAVLRKMPTKALEQVAIDNGMST